MSYKIGSMMGGVETVEGEDEGGKGGVRRT